MKYPNSGLGAFLDISENETISMGQFLGHSYRIATKNRPNLAIESLLNVYRMKIEILLIPSSALLC